MAWIESHIELERHPKTLKLKAALGCSLEHTLGVLHRFWYWTLNYAENGNLEKYGIDGVSEAIGIDANKLIESGWIDVSPCTRVHDWWDYIGRFLQSKYKNYPWKWKSVQRTYLGRTKAGSKPKLPNLTKPNLTKPNLTKPNLKNSIVRIPFQKPTPKEVSMYSNSIGFDLDGQKFCDYYESKGWLVGKTPMKNWQACVRTWKSNNLEMSNAKPKDHGYATAKQNKYPD